ncbi:MAG: hypothetical protein ACJAZT_001665 [Gammaproteobacteria bacterium]|jgi:hypothetical protein
MTHSKKNIPALLITQPIGMSFRMSRLVKQKLNRIKAERKSHRQLNGQLAAEEDTTV